MPRNNDTAPSKSDETRSRILNAALELFREHGFEQTTMRQIAAAADVAVGAAYYYFESKDALVMAFYERAQREMEPLLEQALAAHKGFARRLRALFDVKFQYFERDRSLLGALSVHVDPTHPLSPFSDQTRHIRDKDIGFFACALEGAGVRIPPDLSVHLPRLLWMYQMGLILFWVYDHSSEQLRTRQLVDKSASIVVRLIAFSGFPLLRPVRKSVVELLKTIYAE
jgi:AcrR family transcriptional regulator